MSGSCRAMEGGWLLNERINVMPSPCNNGCFRSSDRYLIANGGRLPTRFGGKGIDMPRQIHNIVAPHSALLTETSAALFTDYYQLTMGQADFDDRNDAIVTANYYVRKIPQGEYLIVAGLEQVIHYILNFRFSEDDLAWLAEKIGLSSAYLESLRDFRFTGSVFAVPEGTPVFPHEPIINITGRSRDIQLFETYLLSMMNFQTLVATKATRIMRAAQRKPVLDFGARRAHGRDAGILAARAAFIGGAKTTSLVAAGRYLGIPVAGTMAHKFVSERPTELEAFRAYAKAFPDNTTLLLDTYNTLEGAKNACIVAHEMARLGQRLRCVRLDSGDLLTLSKQVRQILDAEGLDYVEILVSNDLDEFQIDTLLRNGAPIDGFGVGTRLSTGANFNSLTGEGGVSALGGVYKLVEREGVPVGKRSDEPAKATIPGKKQVYRLTTAAGGYAGDLIVLWDEPVSDDGQPLLIPIIIEGELVYSFPELQEIQKQTAAELKKLATSHKVLTESVPYDVELHPTLKRLLEAQGKSAVTRG